MRSLSSREGTPADDQESAQLSVAAIREAVGALRLDEVCSPHTNPVTQDTEGNDAFCVVFLSKNSDFS